MPARLKPLERKPAAKRRSSPGEKSRALGPHELLAETTRLLEERFGVPAFDGPRDALEVLVLTILSQNTTDLNALRGYTRLCERYARPGIADSLRDATVIPRREDGSVDPVAIRLSQVAEAFFSPEWAKVAAAPERELMDVIRPAGLPNTKAPAIQRVLAWLHKKTGGWKLEPALVGLSDVDAVAALSAIKGVGVKTASVTLIEARGSDLCPVDTHVNRIIARLGVVPLTSAPAKTYQVLHSPEPKPKRAASSKGAARLLPVSAGFSLHHNLLTLGRTICTARVAKCGECPLSALCPNAGVES